MAAVFLLVWVPLTISGCRDRQRRWVFTEAQEERAGAEDAARDALREAKRQERLQQEIRDSMTRLHDLKNEHGDAGIVAFMLNIPVEKVLKISGDQ